MTKLIERERERERERGFGLILVEAGERVATPKWVIWLAEVGWQQAAAMRGVAGPPFWLKRQLGHSRDLLQL